MFGLLLQSRQATDGSTRRTVEIVANRLQALSGKSAPTWLFCDRCGCSVDTDLIHLNGHH